ncbi:hypothetical protein [Fimbriimonas ginsengisoli]|uniref:Uncharacterized protein n=1 Tax=Fimbriimonas ginsengisoli Gsoil 348 TaxID=661478 RepID=A0A068NKJ2_FIMGI|nr:hypothetical protein [Fimbriimonas ginsengisoli]AIE84006.1 hypothetical protein OP10G_0638 [Fimbriimonas ginsengisoli Gsoil 348]
MSLLIGGLVSVIVFQQLVTLMIGQQSNSDMNASTAQTRAAIDTLADHLRGADACTNSSNGTVDSVLDAATATSLTYYYDGTACNKITYSFANGTLSRTAGGVTTSVVTLVSAVSFTYYKAASYNSPWTTTTNPNAPTAAERPFVCGVLIDITTSSSGVTNRMTTTVRMRNAPKKVRLDGL